MINIQRLYPRAFAWQWRRDQRVLLIGLWFFAVGIDFGLKRSAWFKHFTKTCDFCRMPLRINSRMQNVKYHSFCREPGRRMEYKRMKAEKKRAIELGKRNIPSMHRNVAKA